MGNINSLTGIVKILETPRQKTISKNILATKVRAQFPQARNNCVIHLTFWGKLADYIAKYYKVNDYVLVKGYLSVREETKLIDRSKLNRRTKKKVELTVLKVYPFLLNHDQSKFSTDS